MNSIWAGIHLRTKWFAYAFIMQIPRAVQFSLVVSIVSAQSVNAYPIRLQLSPYSFFSLHFFLTVHCSTVPYTCLHGWSNTIIEPRSPTPIIGHFEVAFVSSYYSPTLKVTHLCAWYVAKFCGKGATVITLMSRHSYGRCRFLSKGIELAKSHADRCIICISTISNMHEARRRRVV